MAPTALRLPIRSLTSAAVQRSGSQWICRRCLASTASDTTASRPPMPPPSVPQKKPAEEATDYDPTIPSSQRDYRLTTTDFYLKKTLPQRIPPQYLMYSTSDILAEREREAREKVQSMNKTKRLVGVVVSAGKMDKTVKVRLPALRWNKKIHKYFSAPTSHLVHDPNNSLVVGDVVLLHRLRASTAVHHVVAEIISPFGTPAADRPPVPTPDDRLAKYKKERFAKLHRRALRRKAANGDAEAIRELRAMGLDPGKGVEVGKGAKGQKLSGGESPGGKHEVGKMNERGRANKEKAMKREAQAEENLLEAREVGEELAESGLEGESARAVDEARQGPISKREGVR